MALVPPGMADDVAAAQYARWLATTPQARDPETRPALANKLGVSVAHLDALHNAPWWHDFVEAVCGDWTPGFSRSTTDGVLEAVAKKALTGDVPAAKLYLEMAGVYIPSRAGRSGKILEAETPEEAAKQIPTHELEAMLGDG